MFRVKLYDKNRTGHEMRAGLIQSGKKIELWNMEYDGTMQFIKTYDDLNKLAKEWSGEE